VAGDEAGVLGVVALVHLAWCRHADVCVVCVLRMGIVEIYSLWLDRQACEICVKNVRC
jgi:hypothetical protein